MINGVFSSGEYPRKTGMGSHMNQNYPIIVGITGASGATYGIKLLKTLRALSIPSHLIISKPAALTIATETDYSLQDVQNLATHYENVTDIGAVISSGSYKTRGMIIAPCSGRTMAAIAAGLEDNLITRAASVVLKERRKLVLLFRETPLHNIHIENMLKLSNMGAIIAPPVPAFYNKPKSIDDIVSHTIGRLLDLFDIDVPELKRWGHCPLTIDIDA
jgi:4-hydroxy-3-polyprenylbenzoate decarboxylase